MRSAWESGSSRRASSCIRCSPSTPRRPRECRRSSVFRGRSGGEILKLQLDQFSGAGQVRLGRREGWTQLRGAGQSHVLRRVGAAYSNTVPKRQVSLTLASRTSSAKAGSALAEVISSRVRSSAASNSPVLDRTFSANSVSTISAIRKRSGK